MPEPHGPTAPSAPTAAVRAAVGRVWRSVRPAPDAGPQLADQAQTQELRKLRRKVTRLETANSRVTQRLHRLAGAVVGDTDFDETTLAERGITFADVRTEARRARALAVLGELSAQGVPIEIALVETVRELLSVRELHVARALALGLNREDNDLRRIGLAMVLGQLKEEERAWKLYEQVPEERLAELVPVEASEAALASGGEAGVALAVAIARHHHPAGVLVRLAGQLIVVGEVEVAKELGDRVEARLDELTDEERRRFGALAYWLKPEPVQEPPAGAVRLGVLDYHQPDLERASQNVGDYVQTLAMLGNVARFRGVRFSGLDGMGELAAEVQQRIRPELWIDSPEQDVHLVRVSRDFSEGDPIPEATWMLAFGWHMHPAYRIKYGLPYHPNIRPLYVSFHVNRPAALDEATIAHLRENGPIGCRDWTTVDLLLSAGVDAFFTGCLTTTVNAAFPDLDQVERIADRTTAVIDLPDGAEDSVEGPTTLITHAEESVRDLDLTSGTRAALALLDRYQRELDGVYTSRLHSYLPATSLGLPARFEPKKFGDVRFDGLLGMAPGRPEFVAMQEGIRELLRPSLELILGGAAEETVREDWRNRTAAAVSEAKERFAKPLQLAPPEFDVAAAVAAVAADTHRYGPHDGVDEGAVTDVTLSLDANFKSLLPVTVESIVSHASGPVRLWITARGLDEQYRSWFHRCFPEVPVTFLGCDGVAYGEVLRMIPHITVATMDRLLLPELLPALDRVVYIDIDTVTEGDVRELAAVDLAGAPVAGRPGRQAASSLWRKAGDQLGPREASELRRTMSARHAFDFMAINCGVLVLDLAQMRADRFVEEWVPLVGLYGLNDQDLMNAYAGHRRAELEAKWNALPALEELEDLAPGIVHYAGAGKPWQDRLVPYGGRWVAVAESVERRAGQPPA